MLAFNFSTWSCPGFLNLDDLDGLDFFFLPVLVFPDVDSVVGFVVVIVFFGLDDLLPVLALLLFLLLLLDLRGLFLNSDKTGNRCCGGLSRHVKEQLLSLSLSKLPTSRPLFDGVLDLDVKDVVNDGRHCRPAVAVDRVGVPARGCVMIHVLNTCSSLLIHLIRDGSISFIVICFFGVAVDELFDRDQST